MALPVAGIVCIVLACWVVLVLALFGLYRFLKHRGSCDCECAPCGTEGGESCPCCKAISDSCDCCNPSLNGCLNSVCPKKKVSCVDIILCQCCAEPGQESCLLNIFPCCPRDCECCDDGCCTCCADCDALVCCCLEIRLVSKSNNEENFSPAAKYTSNNSGASINKSKQTNSGKQDQTLSKADLTANTAKKKTENIPSFKSSGIKSNQNTPRTPASARSVSQIQLSDASLNTKQQRIGKPATKMKPPSGPSQKTETKSNTANSRSLPVPPTVPSRSKTSVTNKTKTGGRKRTQSEPSASELREIPVKQRSVLLHSHLYETTRSLASGSCHGDPDLVLGLPQHFDAISQAVSLDASSVYLQSLSGLPHSPGTILDGAGTHRSLSAGSTFSVHFEDSNMLTSPRPLPRLPAR